MTIFLFLFWFSLSILFYCYAGYGMLLYLFNGVRRFLIRKDSHESGIELMPVTMIVAAFNEREVFEKKIANTFSLDYPPELLSFIFITDGSTDDPATILKNHPRIKHLHQPERKGKLAAIKRAMQHVQTPVVVFSDANTMLNTDAVRRLVAHYANKKVGGVAGEKKIAEQQSASAIGEAEGHYWQYESFLKKQDAGFYTVVGAAGELFSIRTDLFVVPPDNMICDDFIISMKVCLQGFRIGYEPGAYAVELPSASLREEQKRKIRISAGAYQAARYLVECLNVFKHPLLSFQYISRRLLRWIVCPLLLFFLFISNIIIACKFGFNNFYTVFLTGQMLFYLLALPGWWMIRTGRKAGWLSVPFYFVFMNYCLIRGFLLFISGKHTVLWEKSLRETSR